MDALLADLQRFVAFRTVAPDSDAKRACLEWIAQTFLQSSGLQMKQGVVRGCPYLFLEHPNPKLLWFGHTDVVPGSDEQFTVRIDGDKAFGRGVKDMKGADLTFLTAYREACKSGNVPAVSVLLTSDEETGGYGPPALLDDHILGNVPVAFTPDTGEGDGIVTELKGAVWARLRAAGKSGHASQPWLSTNPIPELLPVIQSLQKIFPVGGPDDWGITVTPTQLSASDAMNRIPEEAWCMLDVRFPRSICVTPTDALALVAKHVPAGFTLEHAEHADPTYCDPNHEMVQRIRRIAHDVTGNDVAIRREFGASDARHFTARGIPAFLYGPIGGDLHGAHEWVSIASLHQHVEINRRLLAELSK